MCPSAFCQLHWILSVSVHRLWRRLFMYCWSGWVVQLLEEWSSLYLNVNPALCYRGLLHAGVGWHCMLARGTSWKDGVRCLPGVHTWLQPQRWAWKANWYVSNADGVSFTILDNLQHTHIWKPPPPKSVLLLMLQILVSSFRQTFWNISTHYYMLDLYS